MDTDEAFWLYSALIFSAFVHTFWKLIDTDEPKQYNWELWNGLANSIRWSNIKSIELFTQR